jgi:DNA-nicking Smr family endonuclease
VLHRLHANRIEIKMDDKQRLPSPEDTALFRSSVGDVKPLDHDRHEQRRPRPPAIARQRELDERRVLEELDSGAWEPWEMETGDELFYKDVGVQDRLIRKLRRGLVPIEAELDLHGMTVSTAKRTVGDFLAQARAGGLRCVRIIHGKGLRSRNKQPVLKGKLDRWLRLRREVLAFCSARPSDGGAGAVYVLLRRPGVK